MKHLPIFAVVAFIVLLGVFLSTRDYRSPVPKAPSAEIGEVFSEESEEIANLEASGKDSESAGQKDAAGKSMHTLLTEAECGSLIASFPFYWDPSMQAVRVEKELVSKGRAADASLLRAISCIPQATWLLGTNKNAEETVRTVVLDAEKSGKIPVFVLYNVPDYTSVAWGTGIGNGDAYISWVRGIARAIGTAPAWIILEPDAMPFSHGLDAEERALRFSELSGAVGTLKNYAPVARVFLDAGHSGWKMPEVISGYLESAGIREADGFSLNVSNYQPLESEIVYGERISEIVGGKHFVIDTSRNGSGSAEPGAWCNAPGRALGRLPTMDTGNPFVDAFLWVKPPGESDGACNGGPPPGLFWIEYALELIKNAS